MWPALVLGGVVLLSGIGFYYGIRRDVHQVFDVKLTWSPAEPQLGDSVTVDVQMRAGRAVTVTNVQLWAEMSYPGRVRDKLEKRLKKTEAITGVCSNIVDLGGGGAFQPDVPVNARGVLDLPRKGAYPTNRRGAMPTVWYVHLRAEIPGFPAYETAREITVHEVGHHDR